MAILIEALHFVSRPRGAMTGTPPISFELKKGLQSLAQMVEKYPDLQWPVIAVGADKIQRHTWDAPVRHELHKIVRSAALQKPTRQHRDAVTARAAMEKRLCVIGAQVTADGNCSSRTAAHKAP